MTALIPVYYIILQGTSLCNLNCDYCYLPDTTRKVNKSFELDILEKAFSNIFQSSLLGESLTIFWHAGEPLTLPLTYYKQAFELLDKLKFQYLRPEFELKHAIQTNATLLTQEWCDFIKTNQISVGVSCDGPEFLHNAYRKTWNGQSTHSQVMAGMKLLKENSIPFGTIAVLTPNTLEHPDAFFEFFSNAQQYATKELEVNLVRDTYSNDEAFSLNDEIAGKYKTFLKRMIARMHHAPGQLNIANINRLYDKLSKFAEVGPGITDNTQSIAQPLHTLTITVDGDVTTFFPILGLDNYKVGDIYGDQKGFIIGNLLTESLEAMANSYKLKRMKQDFEDSVQACRNECDYFSLCGGGSPVVKHVEHGTFNVSETESCRIHIKTFIDAVVDTILDEKKILPSG